jgi:hypothetical protein
MSSASNEQHHLPKLDVVLALSRSERMSIEERKDRSLEVVSVDRLGHDAAVRTLGGDTTTAEEVLQHLKDHDVVPMLIGLEHRRYQPPSRVYDRRVRTDAHGEASLAVDEAGDVIGCERASRPSLLIVPTRRIVTEHATRVVPTSDIIGTAGSTGCSSI